MTTPDRYASILNSLVEIAKARGMENPGDEVAAVCYELLEAAISEAEVYGTCR
ncbi:MAG: hypothetical protein ACXWTK_02840 [Methylobacter sp.]